MGSSVKTFVGSQKVLEGSHKTFDTSPKVLGSPDKTFVGSQKVLEGSYKTFSASQKVLGSSHKTFSASQKVLEGSCKTFVDSQKVLENPGNSIKRRFQGAQTVAKCLPRRRKSPTFSSNHPPANMIQGDDSGGDVSIPAITGTRDLFPTAGNLPTFSIPWIPFFCARRPAISLTKPVSLTARYSKPFILRPALPHL